MLEFLQIAQLESETADIRQKMVARDCALLQLLVRKGILTQQEYDDEYLRQVAIADQIVAEKRDAPA